VDREVEQSQQLSPRATSKPEEKFSWADVHPKVLQFVLLQTAVMITASVLAIYYSQQHDPTAPRRLPPDSGVSGIAAWNATGTLSEYVSGVKAGNAGAIPIEIKGISGQKNATITLGHYWFPQTAPSFSHRNSYFTQYYYQDESIFRYDEIFLYDPVFDKTHGGAEMLEVSNMIKGVFTNVNLTPNMGLTNGSQTCIAFSIAQVGAAFPSSTDPSDPSISEYLGVVTFPSGYMQVGITFDAYSVRQRWPVPGAVVVYYVDRTPQSSNYGFISSWLIIQPSGVNYFWDFSKIIDEGDAAIDKFRANPTYVFGLPQPLVKGCSCMTGLGTCGDFGTVVELTAY